MGEIDRIRDQLRRSVEGDAWHGPALLEVLNGVDLVMATARPLPEAHSIAELVLHVTTWMDVAGRRVLGDWSPVSEVRDFPPAPTDEAAWTKAVENLTEAAASLDRLLSREDDGLVGRMAPDGTYRLGLMLDGVIQHNLYHAGQIAILKTGAA